MTNSVTPESSAGDQPEGTRKRRSVVVPIQTIIAPDKDHLTIITELPDRQESRVKRVGDVVSHQATIIK